MNKYLHIIAFNVPYPPDYGGAIDVYYKIKALHDTGVKIILHCYDYGRGIQPELLEWCVEVNYYRRRTGFRSNLSLLPYNVVSRNDSRLLDRLLKDDYPILFEGLHTCLLLGHPALKSRVKVLRQHNIEHDYYYQLFKTETNLTKRAFYIIEACRLRWFEKILKCTDATVAVSLEDTKELKKRYQDTKVEFIPCFHGHSRVTSRLGRSDYILYHGNLSVVENEKAALTLVNDVFGRLGCKCVIAGKNPSKRLRTAVLRCANVELKANPTAAEMNELVAGAQINVLITFQPTGLKLKLLNSLFCGRYTLVNSLMLTGSGLDEICVVADDADGLVEKCKELMSGSIEQKDLDKRKELLSPFFTDSYQAQRLVSLIWGE